MNGDGAATKPVEPADAALFGTLCRMWEHRDPVPADLAERVLFALSLDNLEVELLRLEAEVLSPVGARGEEEARTVTFTSPSLSVMITISEIARAVRLDGWITSGSGLSVGLRNNGGERRAMADEDGRFSFDSVRPGLAQLVFHPTAGAGLELPGTVVTPAIQV